MTEPELIFIAPATREEGIARLLAATLYLANPGIPFFEVRLVEEEIERLEKWVRAALRPMTRKELAAAVEERCVRIKEQRARGTAPSAAQ